MLNPDQVKMIRVQADTDQVKQSLIQMLRESKTNKTLSEAIIHMMFTCIRKQDESVDKMKASQNAPERAQVRAILEYFHASLLSIGITSFLESLESLNEGSTEDGNGSKE